VLTPADVLHWERYLELERRDARKQALALLAELIRSVQEYPEAQRHAWLRWLCHLVVDRHEPLPIRHPLVRELMAPFLVEAERRGDADAPRWVDYFLEHFRGGAELWHGLEVRRKSPLQLLEAAVERNPEDVVARKALAEYLEYWFHSCLHELPSGVLFGFNGASVEECHILLRYLALLEEQLRFLGERERSADFLRKCERHFRGYADYLSSPGQYTSYEDYIAKRLGGEE
jgi:hypothetical protein